MRILLTTDTVGGVWTFGQELAAGLLGHGHAVALVSFGRLPSAGQSRWVGSMEKSFKQQFRFVASDAPLEWMDNNGRALADGADVLRQVAGEFRPEVLHSSQFCWGAVPLGPPVVITAHSDVLSWAEACRPDGLEDSDWLRSYVRLVTDGLAGATAVVAPTAWMGRALRRNFPVRNGVGVVANGRCIPSPGVPARERSLRAISVGRIWDQAKGVGLLAEGDWPVPVVVAGEDQFGGHPHAAMPGVTTLGLLDEEELHAELRASAIYLCLSVYEPFGLAAVEAGLCGCMVVCRDIPALREVWGEDAAYFSGAEDLRALLHRSAASREMLAHMQARASRRAARYSRDSMTRGYLGVYREAIAAGVAHDSGVASAGVQA